MRHYEIVFLVDPEQSEQVPDMIERYRSIVESNKGKVHRLEDWGIRQLAYAIDGINKAHYVLMNIECDPQACAEISHSFQFSDAVIRNLILRLEQSVSKASPVAIAMAEEKEKAIEKDGFDNVGATAHKGEMPPTKTEADVNLDKGDDGAQSQHTKTDNA